MTLTRLLGAALLVCSTAAFAQTQNSTAADKTPDRKTANSAEPWNLVSPPSSDLQSNSLDRIQVNQFKINAKSESLKLSAPNDAIALNAYDQPGGENVCFAIRSYVVARDRKDSDSVHLVSSTNCVRARHLELRKVHVEDAVDAR